MIQCTNIIKSYRNGSLETYALKGLSFSIANGEFVAIMGPSGSGKSTLMHILGCLDTPTSGTYMLEKHNVSTCSESELAIIRNKKIGFVFQAFNLLGRTSVIRNVALPLVYAAMPQEDREKKVQHALISAAFPKQFWQYVPSQLSGGMVQRVAIARALVNDPSLILADEPTGNLDTHTGEIVLSTFQRLHKEDRRTIVLITHESYVAEHAQRIITLRDGKIISDENVINRRIARHDMVSL